jgi:cytidylate kinase
MEKCLPFISSQFLATGAQPGSSEPNSPRLAVTISRQSGSGAHFVGQELANYLQLHGARDARPWTVFDRNLVTKVLQDHNLPERLARFMPEDRTSEVADAIDELLGVHPPSSELTHQTAETILTLAEQGNVILIGRGANLITRKLNHVFHVRLVGSLERRVQHLVNKGMGKTAALDLIRKEDRGRKRYLKKHFDQDLDDPLLYHLVINTDLVSYEKAAQIIGDAVLNRLQPQSSGRVQESRTTRRAQALP